MRYLSSLFVLAILTLSAIVFALPRRALEGRKFAVVVGVSGYLPPSEPGKGGQSSLRFAHKDAERMSAKLKALGWETTLLQSLPAATASGATKAKILSALRALKTNPEDSVLFYFSGHGVQVDKQDCLLPADVTLTNVGKDDAPVWRFDRETVISSKELGEAFGQMLASKRLMIVDACRFEPPSSKSGENGSVDQGKLGEVVKYRESGPVSFGVMYSCLAGEKSWETENGGVFTNALISAFDSGRISDSDGTIALGLLHARAREKVAEHVKANPGQKMTPNVLLNEIEPIILGVLKTSTGGSAVVLPTRARFGVEGAPNGAKLTVDGVAQSGLTYEVEVGPGGKKTVVAVVSAPGFVAATYQVSLQAGAYTPLKASLDKTASTETNAAQEENLLAGLEWNSLTLAGGQGTLRTENGEAIWKTSKSGKEIWDTQFFKVTGKIRDGSRYRLSFDICGDLDGVVEAFGEQSDSPFAEIGLPVIKLRITRNWESYTFDFLAKNSTDKAIRCPNFFTSKYFGTLKVRNAKLRLLKS